MFFLLQLNLCFFTVGARVWACKWEVKLSWSDSHWNGAEETEWECILWSQHACASQPCGYSAQHSYPTRSALIMFCFPLNVKVKFMLYHFVTANELSCCFLECRKNGVFLGYCGGQGSHRAREQETVRAGSESFFFLDLTTTFFLFSFIVLSIISWVITL